MQTRAAIWAAVMLCLLTAATPHASAADYVSYWAAPVNGNWNDATKWTGTSYPNNGNGGIGSYEAVINASGGPSVFLNTDVTIDKLTISHTGATLYQQGGVFQAGTIELVSGNYYLNAGTLKNTTITGTDGFWHVTGAGGTAMLQDVTIGRSGEFAGGYLKGTINLTNSSTINVTSTNVLPRIAGVVTFTGSGVLTGNYTLLDNNDGGAILGSDVWVHNSSGLIVNDLTLNGRATVDNHGLMSLQGRNSFTNNGAIEATNSSQLYLQNVNNLGTINAVGAQSVTLDGFSNSGSITTGNASLYLGGSFTRAAFDTINRNASAPVIITGEMDNTGRTLIMDGISASSPWLLSETGVIKGGTITAATSAGLTVPITAGGGFKQTVIATDIATVRDLSIDTSATFSGSKLAFANNSDLRLASTNVILSGSGSILFTQSNGEVVGGSTSYGLLTVDTNLKVQATGGNATIALLNAVKNNGTLSASGTNSTMRVNVAQLTNNGTLEAINGGQLLIAADLNGPLGSFRSQSGGLVTLLGRVDNTARVLTLTSTTGDLQVTGTIEGGVVRSTGGGQLIAAGANLRNVTLDTPVLLTSSGLNIRGGAITLTNNAVLQGSAQITAYGGASISGTGQINGSGSIQANGGVLTLGPGITVANTNDSRFITATNGGSVVNQGLLSVSGASQFINVGADLTNSGTATAVNGGTLRLMNSFQNNGVIWAGTNSTVELGGQFTMSNVGVLSGNGAFVNITGTMVGTGGGVLTLSNTGLTVNHFGRVVGGTVRTLNGAVFNIRDNSTVDSTTLEGAIAAGYFNVVNGMTVNGVLTANNSINLLNSAALTGTGQIVFNAPQNQAIFAQPGAELTIGRGLTLKTGTNGAYGFSVGSPGLTLTNGGTLWSATPGQTLTISGQLVNTGTLKLSDGTMLIAGSVTTGNLGTIDRSGGVFRVSGLLDNTASSLLLDQTTGSIEVGATGSATATLSGGVLSSTNGSSLVLNGRSTLNNVLLKDLDVTVANGTTSSFTSGVTSTNLRMTFAPGLSSTVALSTSPTFDSATVTVSSGITANLRQAAGILSIGANTRVEALGAMNVGNASATGVINNGLLSATGGSITVQGSSVQNVGTLRAQAGGSITVHNLTGDVGTLTTTNGGSLLIDGNFQVNAPLSVPGASTVDFSGTYQLNAPVSVTGSSSLLLRGGWSNNAGVSVQNSTLGLYSTPTNLGSIALNASLLDVHTAITPSHLAGLTSTASQALIATGGSLDNTGNTILASNGTLSIGLAGGTISGGAIAPGSPNVGFYVSTAPSVLSGVDVQSDLNVSTSLTIQNSSSISSGRRVTLSAGGISLGANQSLPDNIDVVFSGPAVLRAGSGAMVIGPGTTITGTSGGSGAIGAVGTTTTNTGAINATRGSITLTGTWANAGLISVAQTGTLNLAGSFTSTSLGTITRTGTGGVVNITGLMSNSNSTLTLNSPSGSYRLTTGTISGGVVSGTGAAGQLIMGTAFSPFPTIVGVTFQGTNAVESTVNVVNGMTLNGGVITLGNGPSGIVSFSNTSAISGSGQILFASGNVSSITQNAASVLTIGTNISVRATGTNGRIGATGRGWINQGTISAEGSNTITFLGTFTNSGSILASTNARIVAGSGYTQLAGQTLINGTMTGSTVTVRGGTIGGAGTIYNPIVFSGTSSGVNNSSGSLTLTNFAVSSGSTFTKSGDGILNLTGTQSHGANSQFVIDGGTVNLNSDAGKPPASPATANLSILLNAGAMNINAIQELKSLDVADNADPNTFINIGSGVMVNIYGNGTSDGQPPSRSTIEQVYQDLVSPHYGGPGIRITPGTNPDPSYSQLTLGRYTDGFGETALALMEDIVGDVDLDGIVTTADLAILLHNLNVDPASRGVNFFVSFEGDLDFDGLVTTNDLALLLHHLNQTFTPSVGGSFGEITPSLDPTALSLLSSAGFDPGQFGLFISPVPEPGSIGLLSLAAVMLRRPRRKLPHRSPATNG